MTLHQYRVYLAVAKHLNVTRAARELHVTQSAVSKVLRVLQDAHGTTFIKRKRRGIELTVDGKAFRREVESILSRLSRLREKYASSAKTLHKRS